MDLKALESSPESSLSQETDISSPHQGSNSGGLPDSITDLDKLDKFKFDGREMTPRELRQAYLRQQDYTRKTQTLAEERKSFESERKYYENLYADLNFVKSNPEKAQEFLRIYPEKFHQALQAVLNGSTANEALGQQQKTAQQPQVPVELMSKVAKLEEYYNQQEISKNTIEINRTLETMAAKYPDAAKFEEMAIGRVYEAFSHLLKSNPNAKLTADMWEDSFKQIDQFVKEQKNQWIKENQNKQLQANKKSGDVSAGGGTPGRAPAKFKSLKDVTDFAVRDLTGRS